MSDVHLVQASAGAATAPEPAATRPPSVGFPGMLLLLTAIGPTSFQIFLPSLPSIGRDFGVAPGVAQLALSLSMLGIAVATLVYGRLADRFGRRPMLLAGMGLLLTGSLICMLAPTIEVLIAGRIVQAAGGASGMVVGRAIVLDVYGQARSARVLASLLAAMMIAPMLATPIGGFLNDQIGWRANFAVLAVLGAGMLAALWFKLPETRGERGASPPHLFADYAELLRSRAFAGFALQGACAMAAFIAFTTGAPYVLTARGLSATEIGLWFTAISVGFAAGSLLASRLPDGLSLGVRARTGSALALAAAVAALLLTSGSDWPTIALVGPVMMLAFATGITMPASQAGAIGAVPALSGTASGLSGFGGTLVAAAATQVVGVLSNGGSYTVTIAMVALSAVALAAALFVARERPRPA
ncbi:MAG: hypothetical protein AVDCRST_MAG91-2668 [uncultured Sphingomonadaceae bacterium]|uniref:Bcr/CflA family efflux transporter n=1 Tax=uncultured Sphingomonadaceae bacterium TaxID=169976 RepID=A0A6J4TNW1_9SPHN|nr:MAG: hypothetical protein AVDCRST_MAG91-2668 [uncultured Sphingomonadaceae bacterium]